MSKALLLAADFCTLRLLQAYCPSYPMPRVDSRLLPSVLSPGTRVLGVTRPTSQGLRADEVRTRRPAFRLAAGERFRVDLVNESRRTNLCPLAWAASTLDAGRLP